MFFLYCNSCPCILLKGLKNEGEGERKKKKEVKRNTERERDKDSREKETSVTDESIQALLFSSFLLLFRLKNLWFFQEEDYRKKEPEKKISPLFTRKK